jgi:hypothetical protein
MTVNKTTSTSKPIELVEREGPVMFKFDSPGRVLRGRLISIEHTHINDKPAVRYTLHDEEEGKYYTFLGTVELITKIRQSDVGRVIQVQYEGQDSEGQNGKNPMKRFRVYAEKE